MSSLTLLQCFCFLFLAKRHEGSQLPNQGSNLPPAVLEGEAPSHWTSGDNMSNYSYS